ncbi:hypothetical protein L596_018947 [Steinernema carpocapsae]|uniref:PX domain-containing protein n=1 Tax=Steinernema carpocapsae TaxID=34508 RepID=A0A4U5N701_STECR|nr:hypothetical protein L596_018947 [Steinernema carpocapsae]
MAPDGFVDLTHPITCTICDWEVQDSHVEYVIECKRTLGNVSTWRIQRRYNEFYALNRTLECFGVPLSLPPKKYYGNTKERFVKERMAGLQRFLENITMSPIIYASAAVVTFLDLNQDASKDVQSLFLTALRNRRSWTLSEIWQNIGWRSNKTFAAVSWTKSGAPISKHLVSWMPLGIDCPNATIEELNEMLEVMRELSSPYINEPTEFWATRRGIGVVQPIYPDGMLRDHLYKSRADEPFFLKYGFDRQVYTLEQVDVCFIGRQLLESLLLLKSIPIPFVNVHCGNILVTDTGCELLDIQFVLCGQPSLYRPAMVRSQSVKTIQDMMVFVFGELIYELVTGFIVFPDHAPEQAISLCPVDFHPLLRSIFQPDRDKGLPSLTDVIQLPLFASIPVVRMSKKEISISARAKKLFDELAANNERRLHEDQFKLSRSRKLEEWKQFVNSEEQKIKRRKIVHLEQLKMTKDASGT